MPLRRIAVAAPAVLLLGALVGPAAVATPTPASTSNPRSPGKMVLVLDSSGSMKESAGSTTRIDAAKKALRQVVDTLPDEQQVALRVYGAEVEFRDQPGACRDSQRVVDLGTDNRAELDDAIDSYRPFGETPTGYALQQAGKDLGGSGQRTIVLVSDGEPTCDPDPCDVAEQLAEDGVDVHIDVVGLGVSGKARDQLTCVAEKGNGTYYDADDADDIVDSLVESTTRAARPFDFTGTPVTGTAEVDDAPTIATGQYLDTMPRSGSTFYRLERTVEGSTLHVGITTRSDPRATGAGARVAVKSLAAGSTRSCNSSVAFGTVLGMRNPLIYAGTSSWQPTATSECNTEADLVAEISSTSADVAGQPVEVAVYEEPPLADRDTTPTAADPIAGGEWTELQPGTPRATTPGTSIANAPVVSDGSWSADINPGEAQVFAVPVDWGQDVQYQLDTRLTKDAVDAAAVGSELKLTTIGPVRDGARVDYYAKEPKDWSTGALGNTEAGPFRTGARTPRVEFANRLAPDARISGATLPGLRYVQVAYNVRGDEANLPYTLTVKTNGTAGDGAPEYAEVDGLTAPRADSPLTVAAAPTERKEPSQDSPQESDDSGLPLAPIAIGAALVVLLAAGVLLVLRRFRNT